MSTESTISVPVSDSDSATEIEVLLTPKGDGGYRAFSGTLGISLEAESKEAVVQGVKDWIKDNWIPGTELLKVALTPVEHPLARFAGIMRGDPIVDEWRQAIADYRKMVDEQERLKDAEREGTEPE